MNWMYFYNVQIILIAVAVGSDLLDKSVTGLWDLRKLRGIPSQVVFIYRDGGLPEGLEYEIWKQRNAVLEVRENEVCWYQGEGP